MYKILNFIRTVGTLKVTVVLRKNVGTKSSTSVNYVYVHNQGLIEQPMAGRRHAMHVQIKILIVTKNTVQFFAHVSKYSIIGWVYGNYIDMLGHTHYYC